MSRKDRLTPGHVEKQQQTTEANFKRANRAGDESLMAVHGETLQHIDDSTTPGRLNGREVRKSIRRRDAATRITDHRTAGIEQQTIELMRGERNHVYCGRLVEASGGLER